MTNGKRIETEIAREGNGQFGHGFDAVCVCGRRKGAHTAERPFTCDAGGMFGDDDGLPECQGFKKARARRVAS